MKENFLSLVKLIDIEVQEAHRVPNKLDTQKTTLRHIIIKMPNIKDKERHLKAAEKSKEYPKDNQLISENKICRQEETGKKYSK